MKRKSISLFSGAMGLDLGLKKAGFQTIACVENDNDAIKTIRHNLPNIATFADSITNVSGEAILEKSNTKKQEISLIAGGPPCQAFSVFGNRLGIEDARGQLVFEFIRMIDEIRPPVFLMENVRGILSMAVVPKNSSSDDANSDLKGKGSLMNLIFKELNKIGYHVDCFVVNSANYGAPQIRERVLLIGNRYGYQTEFPQPEYSNRIEDNLPPFKTLGDAIGPNSSFTESNKEVMNFSERKLKYLSMVPEGGNWRSLPVEIQKESMGKSWYLKGGRSAYWRKLSYDFPSPTVVTMPNHAGTSMCHPKELRAISVGEAAAIQEFPIDWEFQGTVTSKFRQIGNAVPIKLGNIAGEVIRNLLDKIEKDGYSVDKRCSHNITHIRPHIRTRTFWKDGKSFAGTHSYYEDQSKKTSKQTSLEFD